ncbi:hypothetical protein Sjap_018542 [Stephania japonica]|uniref:Uncharacterized protein n=1 Tax=Stephania japonica TaxID=461633 RepID=A0AAP0NJH4_9MAGN
MAIQERVYKLCRMVKEKQEVSTVENLRQWLCSPVVIIIHHQPRPIPNGGFTADMHGFGGGRQSIMGKQRSLYGRNVFYAHRT